MQTPPANSNPVNSPWSILTRRIPTLSNSHPVNSHQLISHPVILHLVKVILKNSYPVKNEQKFRTHRNDQHLQLRFVFANTIILASWECQFSRIISCKKCCPSFSFVNSNPVFFLSLCQYFIKHYAKFIEAKEMQEPICLHLPCTTILDKIFGTR